MKALKLLIGIGLVVVLALLAVRELGQDRSAGRLEPQALLFPYASGSIGELEFTLAGEAKHAIWRRGPSGRWELAEGAEGTDPGVAPELVGIWSRLRFLEVIEEQPSDLKRYGLEPPGALLRATLKPNDSTTPPATLRLAVGDPSQLKPAFYARLDDFPRVVLISVDAGDLLYATGRKAFGLPIEQPAAPSGTGPAHGSPAH